MNSRTNIDRRIEAAIPRLHRFAWSLTGDRADADDVTQTALERALARRADFESDFPIEAWLLRVARNIWLDQLRRQKVRAAEIDSEVVGRFHAIAGFGDAHTRAESNEALAAFADLPPGQKEVAALVLVEGLSYAETAAALETPLGTVMSRLARARTALAARLLEPEDPVSTNPGAWP